MLGFKCSAGYTLLSIKCGYIFSVYGLSGTNRWCWYFGIFILFSLAINTSKSNSVPQDLSFSNHFFQI